MTDGRYNIGLCNYGCEEEDRHGLIIHRLFRYKIQERSKEGSRSQVQEKQELMSLQLLMQELMNSLLKECEDARSIYGLHRRLAELMKQKPTEDYKTQRNHIWQRKTVH